MKSRSETIRTLRMLRDMYSRTKHFRDALDFAIADLESAYNQADRDAMAGPLFCDDRQMDLQDRKDLTPR